MEQNLQQKIIAALFVKTDALSYTTLAKLTGASLEDIKTTCVSIQEQLAPLGLSLVLSEEECQLTTHPDVQGFIEELLKKEESGELSKSALETLSLVAYLKQATKAEIDYVRGVNSSIMLRTLSIRGLISKAEQKRDSAYVPTTDLLRFMGITKLEDLPEFEMTNKTLTERLRGMSDIEKNSTN